MEDLSGLEGFGSAADDIVKLVATIVVEREPIRHARMMNRLIDLLAKKCTENKTVPANEVEVSCDTLPITEQQIIIALLNDRLGITDPAQKKEITEHGAEDQAKSAAANETAGTQNNSSNENQTIKMETPQSNGTAAPVAVLPQVALNLAVALANEGILIGSYIGKSAPFAAAIVKGYDSVADNAIVTEEQVIDAALAAIEQCAVITGRPGWAKLLNGATLFYNDLLANGKLTGKDFFDALIKVGPQIRALEQAVKVKSKDVNLGPDELALATELGALCKMCAIYFGGTNAAAFITAVSTALNSGELQNVTVKEMVDGGFAVLLPIAQLTNNKLFVTVVTFSSEIYDDVAMFNVNRLFALITNKGAALVAARNVTAASTVTKAQSNTTFVFELTPQEKTTLDALLEQAAPILKKMKPADAAKTISAVVAKSIVARAR